MFAAASFVAALWLRLGREEFTQTVPILVLRVLLYHLGHLPPFHNDRLELWMCSRSEAFEDLLKLKCSYIGGSVDVPFSSSDNYRSRHVRGSNDCEIAGLTVVNEMPSFRMKCWSVRLAHFNRDVGEERQLVNCFWFGGTKLRGCEYSNWHMWFTRG